MDTPENDHQYRETVATSMGAQVVKALENVKHSGDYGEAYYLPHEGRLALVMGDADGQEELGMTPFPEIGRIALGIPGVDGVEFRDEETPGGDWIELGRFGKEVVL